MTEVGYIMDFLFNATRQIIGLFMSNLYFGALIIMPVIIFVFLSIIKSLLGTGNNKD